MTLRAAPGAVSVTLGAVSLGLLTLLLPYLGEGTFSFTGQLAAYAAFILAAGAILFGFPSLVETVDTPRLLAFCAALAAPGAVAAFFSRADVLTGTPGGVTLFILFCANVLRILAAGAVAVSLARYVSSAGVALLIAGVVVVSDLFSVLAGPTRALLARDSAALDLLLLVFPTFGRPLGFALGISDFIFLAFFIAVSRLLHLRLQLTFVSSCLAVLIAMTVGLLLERPVPVLPFIALSFVLSNGDLIYGSLLNKSR